jgi:hypothetical protein
MSVVINSDTFGKRIKKLYEGWRVRATLPS